MVTRSFEASLRGNLLDCWRERRGARRERLDALVGEGRRSSIGGGGRETTGPGLDADFSGARVAKLYGRDLANLRQLMYQIVC